MNQNMPTSPMKNMKVDNLQCYLVIIGGWAEDGIECEKYRLNWSNDTFIP